PVAARPVLPALRSCGAGRRRVPHPAPRLPRRPRNLATMVRAREAVGTGRGGLHLERPSLRKTTSWNRMISKRPGDVGGDLEPLAVPWTTMVPKLPDSRAELEVQYDRIDSDWAGRGARVDSRSRSIDAKIREARSGGWRIPPDLGVSSRTRIPPGSW